MLKCEQNTPIMEKKILKAAQDNFKHYEIYTVFEHGQWWIRFFDKTQQEERTFSVSDAEGYGVFSFEEV